VYGISCCPLADQIFLKLPTPHKRVRRPDLVIDRRVNIKELLKSIKGMNHLFLPHKINQWQDLTNALINQQVLTNVQNISTSFASIGFSTMSRLHAVSDKIPNAAKWHIMCHTIHRTVLLVFMLYKGDCTNLNLASSHAVYSRR